MIIQRWQSLFLLICCALMACFTFMSLGQIQTADFSLNMTSCGLSVEGEATGNGPTGVYLSTWYFFAISLTSAIIPLINIFLFKNLKLQMKVCLVEVLFLIAVIATGGLIGYTAVEGACPGWSTLVASPFLALILDIMAWRYIKRDRDLLLSVDRIR